jgi:hypothetical protein
MPKVIMSRFISWGAVRGVAIRYSNGSNVPHPVGTREGTKREPDDPRSLKCQPDPIAVETAHDELPLWRLGPG